MHIIQLDIFTQTYVDQLQVHSELLYNFKNGDLNSRHDEKAKRTFRLPSILPDIENI